MHNRKFKILECLDLNIIFELFCWVQNTKSCLNKQKVPDTHCCGLGFSRPVWLLFPMFQVVITKRRQKMKIQNQTVLKNFFKWKVHLQIQTKKGDSNLSKNKCTGTVITHYHESDSLQLPVNYKRKHPEKKTSTTIFSWHVNLLWGRPLQRCHELWKNSLN